MGNLPIKTLPVAEHWDCTGCGKCCRGNIVPLDDDDLRRLLDQRWHEHPDFRKTRTIVRQSWLSRRFRLAQRDDGTCVFLDPDGLCRIHKEHGFETKPLVCRMYPLQLVPLEKVAYLTLRRSCPTAAADQGVSMDRHRDQAKAFARERPRLVRPVRPPSITRRTRRSWTDVLAIANSLQTLLTDERYPLVRRLVHGLTLCDLLTRCRLAPLDSKQLKELGQILAENAPQEASRFFADRKPPAGPSAALFHQTVADYLRLHPKYQVRESWQERKRLARAAFAFARGRGDVPQLHSDFPETSFDIVQNTKLGAISADLLRPLSRYFETQAVSKQYLVASRNGWSLIEKYRALAFAFAAGMWMLRYFSCGAGPTHEIMIDVITSIDRGQGFGPLAGRQHRTRIRHLARLKTIEQVVTWYAQ